LLELLARSLSRASRGGERRQPLRATSASLRPLREIVV